METLEKALELILKEKILGIYNERGNIKETQDLNEEDYPIVICGNQQGGVGKSSLSAIIIKKYFDLLNKTVDEIEDKNEGILEKHRLKKNYEFDFNKNVALGHEGFITNYKKLPKLVPLWYDEAVDSFYYLDQLRQETKQGMKTMRKYRYKMRLGLFNIPDISECHKGLIFRRAKALIRVTHKGWLWFYSRKQIKKMEMNQKGMDWAEPNFKDSFKRPEKVVPDLWENYKRHREGKLDYSEEVDEEESGDMSIKEIAEKVKENIERYKKERGDRVFVDRPLVEAEFEIGNRKGRQVKSLVEADLNLNS